MTKRGFFFIVQSWVSSEANGRSVVGGEKEEKLKKKRLFLIYLPVEKKKSLFFSFRLILYRMQQRMLDR